MRGSGDWAQLNAAAAAAEEEKEQDIVTGIMICAVCWWMVGEEYGLHFLVFEQIMSSWVVVREMEWVCVCRTLLPVYILGDDWREGENRNERPVQPFRWRRSL